MNLKHIIILAFIAVLSGAVMGDLEILEWTASVLMILGVFVTYFGFIVMWERKFH